jgi:hypothetical protein
VPSGYDKHRALFCPSTADYPVVLDTQAGGLLSLGQGVIDQWHDFGRQQRQTVVDVGVRDSHLLASSQQQGQVSSSRECN